MPAQFTVDEDNKTYDLSGQAGPLMEILQLPPSARLFAASLTRDSRTTSVRSALATYDGPVLEHVPVSLLALAAWDHLKDA